MSQNVIRAGVLRSSGAAATSFGVLVAVSYAHFSNDMLQALLPAIYPNLQLALALNFLQLGVITFAYQVTASLLQPLIGSFADRRPTPLALPVGTLFGMTGLCVLAISHRYPTLLIGACLLGVSSAVFHPEASRVARMASGNRPGLAQSLFQVGGNVGSAMGPLAAALVVARCGQTSLVFFALFGLLATVVLWNVALWYKHEGIARLKAAAKRLSSVVAIPRTTVTSGITILLALIFSKYFYLVSITNFLTFYLIKRFGVTTQTSQLHLFAFAAAIAAGTIAGGPLGDRFGRKYIIWFSILGTLPFSLLLPHVDLFWSVPVTVVIGLILASAFPAIVVYAQDLVPGQVGMISGLFFGFAFGMAGVGAAVLGGLADRVGIIPVYEICAYLPAIGLLAALLPNIERARTGA